MWCIFLWPQLENGFPAATPIAACSCSAMAALRTRPMYIGFADKDLGVHQLCNLDFLLLVQLLKCVQYL